VVSIAERFCSQQWEDVFAPVNILKTCQTGMVTFAKYANAFYLPFLLAASYFNRVERRRFYLRDPMENMTAYSKLGQMNLALINRALRGSLLSADQFIERELNIALCSLISADPHAMSKLARRMNNLIEAVAHTYPRAIENIEAEFGFHFERQPEDSLIDETDRFRLHQVLPRDPQTSVRRDGKPLLIIPPFVLGANILSFLPAEGRSYAHAFADQGIPTYVRTLKNVKISEAVQVMTAEDDARDTQRFCSLLRARHGSPVTLNGYCQGGFAGLCDLLSGELDDLVDAFITCVAPMDGTRSRGLAEFLRDLPAVFNDLSYGTKIFANGNPVADGDLMGWIYKLKSIEVEAPMLAMWRDMMLVAPADGNTAAVSKTAAALNYWLMNERNDLPMEITRMSFASYNTPITPEGTLPIKSFGKSLNLKRLHAKNIKWLICYGLSDELVEPETALAPLDYIDAEVTPFPKGHVAIATSWSHPDSTYALHHRYEKEGARGPVRFQLDLQADRDNARKSDTPIKGRQP
jgi:hypothetical protein